jgi:hypothetical protein
MAKIVGSVVVGEVVNRTTSFIISKHKERLTTWEGIERLEMAHIKMEAAFDVSGRWQTTDVSLLRWRRKLRRTADDCDAALHRWKLRALEDEAARERLARAPFRRRVAGAVPQTRRARRRVVHPSPPRAYPRQRRGLPSLRRRSEVREAGQWVGRVSEVRGIQQRVEEVLLGGSYGSQAWQTCELQSIARSSAQAA